MPRPLHAGDVFRIEPLSRDSWHSVVKLRGGTEQLLSSCSAVSVWVLGSSCLGSVQALFGRQAAWRLGKRKLWGQMGLHWLCSAAWLFGGWANCSCGVRVGGRRSG